MRMKKTMLLVSSSPSTSVGLRSYLTHIFGRYIKLEARLDTRSIVFFIRIPPKAY